MAKVQPYEGEKPYIFISYAHKDDSAVHSIISRMHSDGFRVWYDRGVHPGTEWDEMIAAKVKSCDYFIAFLSGSYLDSDNCKDELNFARDLDKKRLLVYLEDVTLPLGMQMRLNRLQALFRHKYSVEDEFFAELYKADGIEDFKSNPSLPATPEPKATPKTEPENPDFQIENGVLKRYKGKGGDVIIPEGVTTIGKHAFSKCASLTSVKLPDSVTLLDEYAFLRCTSLKRIVLPKALRFIRQHAFLGSNIKTINFRGSRQDWHNIKKDTHWKENTEYFAITFDYKGE